MSLLSPSENYIKLTFVVVIQKVFSVRLFRAPLPGASGATAPVRPLSLVTPRWSVDSVRAGFLESIIRNCVTL